MRQGLALAAIGAVAGVSVAMLAGRAASSVLFGVTPYDPWTYAASLAIVCGITLVACHWPARRAAAADPVVLLRSE